MRRSVTAFAVLLVFFMADVLPLSALAEVSMTSEPTAGQMVYIAGNPDLYPLEYYDPETEVYEGILPNVYTKISRLTDLELAYIRTGEENEQERLAKNKQAEIVSVHIHGEVEGLSEEYELLSYEKEGEIFTVCIGFTEIASGTLRAQIISELEKIPDSELLGLAVRESEREEETVSVYVWLGIILVLAVLIAVLIVLLVKNKLAERKNRENKLVDPLTGIGNNAYFEYYYDHFISLASYGLYYIAYIAFDIQQMENYLGTVEAEEMQRYAAGVLSADSGDLDFAARITDGVFVLVFQCPDEQQAAVRVNELLGKLNGYEDEFSDESRMRFRAGIFRLHAANIPAETALFNARQGYHYAVQSKTAYSFSNDHLLNRAALKSKLQRKLTDALKNNEFRVYLQFIADAKAGEIRGAEALSRWQNCEEGLLSPAHYIDSMKTAGIIDRLDFCVLEESCRILESWSKNEKKNLWISCNFTRLTVSQADFLQRFEDILNRYTFDRRNLIIELTEDSLADNKALAFRNVHACKKAGVRIALDDLGSGYSSFSDLCDYPIDIIKIDRRIIAKSITERGNALLRGITQLAHDLGITVLCEGVETEFENENVISAGCDYVQGYYYCRVLPQQDADDYFNQHS